MVIKNWDPFESGPLLAILKQDKINILIKENYESLKYGFPSLIDCFQRTVMNIL